MMMNNEIRDLAPATPGRLLARVVGEVEGKVTQDALAAALDVSRVTVNQILNGRRSITPDMAVRLEYVLGTSAEFWLRAQMRFDLHTARTASAREALGLTRLREPQLEPPAN